MIRMARSQVWSAQTYKWVAAFAGAVAVGSGVIALRLPWQPRADFDIIGILFLMHNLPRMVMAFICLTSASVTIRCVAGWLSGGD